MYQRSFFKTYNEESRFSRTELGVVDPDLASFGMADNSEVDVQFVDFSARSTLCHEIGEIESGFETDLEFAVERTWHTHNSQGQILALAFSLTSVKPFKSF